MRPKAPSALLLEAREAAGLTQRELARRAKTTQSVIARIENGQTVPGWGTFVKILRAAGHELRAEIVQTVSRSHMLDDVPRILKLSPEDRIREVANLSRFLAEVRRV